MIVEHVPPVSGDKRNEYHYWPTAKTFEVVGESVPDFILRRDAIAAGASTDG